MKMRLWLLAAALMVAGGSVQAAQSWDSYVSMKLAPGYFKQQADAANRPPSRDMTMVLLAARKHWSELSPTTQALAQHWLARPTFTGTCANTYQTPHFLIHFIDATYCSGDANAATGAYVATVAGAAEAAYTMDHGTLGYALEKDDGSLGGNSLYDIYLASIGSQGVYGYTAPEQSSQKSYSFIVIDNDMSDTKFPFGTSGTPAAMVTTVHEYFHAVQIGAYDQFENPAWMEQTATWIEGVIYPGVPDVNHNQNFEYLGDSYTDANDNEIYDTGDTLILDVNKNGLADYGSMAYPSQALDAFSPSVDYTIQYGRFVWPQYLTEKFATNDIIRLIWEQCATASGDNLFTATDTVLTGTYASSLAAAYTDYANWNYDVGSYASGAYYPHARVDEYWLDTQATTVNSSFNSAPSLHGSPLPHLSSIYIRIDNPSGQYNFTSNGTAALTVIEYSGGVGTANAVALTAGAGSWTAGGGTKAIAVISNVSPTNNCVYWTFSSNGVTAPALPTTCTASSGGGTGGGVLDPQTGGGGGGAFDMLALSIVGLFGLRRRLA